MSTIGKEARQLVLELTPTSAGDKQPTKQSLLNARATLTAFIPQDEFDKTAIEEAAEALMFLIDGGRQ